MQTTSVFGRNIEAYNAGKRYIVNKGSTRSSKTYSILQLLWLIANLSARPRVISIVSESMPHLKKGCIRDLMDIVTREHGKWDLKAWNATDKVLKVRNSIIEFFSADDAAKVHGPSRDILYVNECINIEYETYRQLAIRTTETIFLDCNPAYEFWLDEKVLPQEDALLIHSTYKDNEFLSAAQVKEIEGNRGDKDWWTVYGEGKTGNRQGVVVRNWDIVNNMPDTYKKRWLGLDFGFTNDPTAIVDIRLHGGELWINELLYDKGFDNPMIAAHLAEMGIPKDVCIVADSAEPKSIREIASQGWHIEPVHKGKDSIATGIAVVNRYRKHVTGNSLNVINEFRNYRWQNDTWGNTTNIPIDHYNHSIDAIRYVCLNKLMEKNTLLNYAIIRGRSY